jgi:hypothetical protein
MHQCAVQTIRPTRIYVNWTKQFVTAREKSPSSIKDNAIRASTRNVLTTANTDSSPMLTNVLLVNVKLAVGTGT